MMREQNKRNRSGFVLVTVGLFMTALLLMAGFAVDLGAWYLNATKLQRAVDAASLAGAAALPDEEAAKAEAAKSLAANGYGDNVILTTDITGSQFRVSLKDPAVSTYFLRLVKPTITIARDSTATKGSRAPALGSPYNVLGTGDLNIPGIPVQNFWLAINGKCEPKEDGDYFNSWFDANKGPFTGSKSPDGYFEPSSEAKHHCPTNSIGIKNNEYNNGAGYNYFVDIPPEVNGKVDIKVYDPTIQPFLDGPDALAEYPKDNGLNEATGFAVFNTNGTPDDFSDDIGPLTGSIRVAGAEDPPYYKDWITLYTASQNEIKDGAQFRVTVTTRGSDPATDSSADRRLGVNAFGLGAFKNGQVSGCDTRTDNKCPRVYGRSAMSLFNNLSAPGGSKVTFYFADIDEDLIGTTMNLYLWDPGEGVDKLELLGPDGTPLSFNWKSDPAGPGYSGTNVTSIDTSGTGTPIQPNLSNDFKFNDRLIVIKWTAPPAYAQMVKNAGGKTGVSISYTVNTSPADRTTWGLSVDGGSFSPVHLLRK